MFLQCFHWFQEPSPPVSIPELYGLVLVPLHKVMDRNAGCKNVSDAKTYDQRQTAVRGQWGKKNTHM